MEMFDFMLKMHKKAFGGWALTGPAGQTHWGSLCHSGLRREGRTG